jgi:t-SNARE complex subunit (syntaxin)
MSDEECRNKLREIIIQNNAASHDKESSLMICITDFENKMRDNTSYFNDLMIKIDAYVQEEKMASQEDLRQTAHAHLLSVSKQFQIKWKECKQTVADVSTYPIPDSIKRSLIQRYTHNLNVMFTQFQKKVEDAKDRFNKRDASRIKALVGDSMSDTKIDQIVVDGQASEVIKQILSTDNLQQTIKMIDARHTQILHIETEVRQLAEIFKDLATLVDIQGESLDVITQRIVTAEKYTTTGLADLQGAAKYQKKASNLRYCICCCGVVILFIIVGVPVFLKQENYF